MASFTDQSPPQFSQYVPENNVSALQTVGLYKQQQYDQGLQRIQGSFDNVLNLPIAMKETQEYVKGKVSQLRDNLSKSITGDFSDQRVLSQVGGLTSRIARDPIVQNGVLSTA